MSPGLRTSVTSQRFPAKILAWHNIEQEFTVHDQMSGDADQLVVVSHTKPQQIASVVITQAGLTLLPRNIIATAGCRFSVAVTLNTSVLADERS